MDDVGTPDWKPPFGVVADHVDIPTGTKTDFPTSKSLQALAHNLLCHCDSQPQE